MGLRSAPDSTRAGGPTPRSRWLPEFLEIVARLVERPLWGRNPLPLIWLAGQEAGTAVLDALQRALAGQHRYRVPHGRLDAAEGTASGVRPLLDKLWRELSRPIFGTDRLRFRHYALATWLMDQDLSREPPDDIPGKLTLLLQNRYQPSHQQSRPGRGQTEQGQPPGDDTGGTVYHLLWWLIRWLIPRMIFRMSVSGRIPGLGRRYRWFMNQHFLAPAQSITFPRFASRITAGNREIEPPDEIDKLLVNAFLEDLRRAYRRRPWRPRSWRRTAYPIALIDNVVPGNARHSLLRLVNEVRNVTGQLDPLLLVCAGDPREADDVRPRAADADQLAQEYEKWARALPRARRAQGRGAWIWPLTVPGVAEHPRDTGPASIIAARKPPFFARRTVAAGAVTALCLPFIPVTASLTGSPGCFHRPFADDVAVREIEGECIGYSAGGGFKFNDEPGQERLRDVQARIFAQNKQVAEIWARGDKRRPYVTMVYLGTLTGRETNSNEEAYAAEREELEGMAVAQYDGLDTSASAYGAPLLRIVIANAGFQMRYANEAVDMIAELARNDSTVIGVIGLVESRTTTGGALRRLNAAGLPAIAPTLSADGMYKYSNLYLQVSAPNRDQGRLVEQYARNVLDVSRVRIYYTSGERSSVPDDLYVNTLLADLRQVFGSRLEYDTEFRSGVSLHDECGYPGMLFFGGRWSDFDSFLRALSSACGDNPPAHLVANDSVNRYMANPALRSSAPGNVPLTYVSKAGLVGCDELRRRDGEEGPNRFLRRIQAPDVLTPPRCDGTAGEKAVGERVGLAYDSTMMTLQAVRGLAGRLRQDSRQPWNPRSITPVAVYTEILRQNSERPYPGVTGYTRFDSHSGEPRGKPIWLFQVKNIPDTSTPPRPVFQCGAAGQDDRSTCRRP
jgi:hypothetical protein